MGKHWLTEGVSYVMLSAMLRISMYIGLASKFKKIFPFSHFLTPRISK
jgi:hypothetical protein